MHIDGRCHCGQISFEADIDPEQISVCHCTDCQVLTGTAFRITVPVPRERLRLTGEPKCYAKVAESGRTRLQGFCPNCGTQLFATGTGAAAAMVGLRWGAIRQRRELKPQRQIWCRSAVDWLDELDDLPAAETA